MIYYPIVTKYEICAWLCVFNYMYVPIAFFLNCGHSLLLLVINASSIYNPLNLNNSMHILHSVLHRFPKVLTRRI